jgi:hypothetical protein
MPAKECQRGINWHLPAIICPAICKVAGFLNLAGQLQIRGLLAQVAMGIAASSQTFEICAPFFLAAARSEICL